MKKAIFLFFAICLILSIGLVSCSTGNGYDKLISGKKIKFDEFQQYSDGYESGYHPCEEGEYVKFNSNHTYDWFIGEGIESGKGTWSFDEEDEEGYIWFYLEDEEYDYAWFAVCDDGDWYYGVIGYDYDECIEFYTDQFIILV